MNRKVYIIGTAHSYQFKEKSAAENQCFFEMLKQNASDLCIAGIAEECNLEALTEERRRRALAENELKTSSVEDLALELSLPHRYCDPDRDTRNRLGIQQRNRIKFIALFNEAEISDDELDEREKESFMKREHYWASELLKFDTWPALFICGANHVDSFTSVLEENGLIGEVIEEDWNA